MESKINNTIAFIRQYAAIADKYGGYKVMFSGGKDSQVMLDLFRRAGVNYHAYYCVTTNDPPENVYFIRKNYPDVTFVHPKRTFLQLIEDKGMLPTRQIRFCCEKLKENHGKGFVATGVRREESTKRKYYKPIEFQSRNKQARVFNEHKMRKNRKVRFNPILEWREDEIWQYIEDNDIPINPCYEVRGRVGCLFCPYATKKELVINSNRYPLYFKNFMRTIQKCIDNGRFENLEGREDVWQWWLSKLSIKDYNKQKRQLRLF